MHLYYLSDLHLSSEGASNSDRFRRFMQEIPQESDVVVLGGDIFDLFVGNKPAFQKKFSKSLNAIRAAAQKGCSVYYLEGNHDFHLNEVFSIESGIMVKPDEFFLEFEGKKIWITHGDLIDEEDRGYRLLRATTRHPLVRNLIDIVPGKFIDDIGNWSSKQSRKYNNPTSAGAIKQARTRDLFKTYAEEKVQQGFDLVLIGHSHIQDNIDVKYENKKGQYLNLGFATDELYYGSLPAAAKKMELCSFS